MPSFEVEFEVFCSCGEGLCNQATGGQSSYPTRSPIITVEPCQKCLSDKYDEGYDKGYNDGYDEGSGGEIP